MEEKWLGYIQCPDCSKRDLSLITFNKKRVIGIILCKDCKQWFIINEGILELIPEELNWQNKIKFYLENRRELVKIERIFPPTKHRINNKIRYKQEQAAFFDSFFEKERKSYQESSFWKAEYSLSLSSLAKKINKKSVIVDAGCGEGACGLALYKRGTVVIGFDVSRHSISVAKEKANRRGITDNMFFFVGDAENPPLASNIADTYILFAVLHHVASPRNALTEAARIMKFGGNFFAHDNNNSGLRWIFDLFMRLSPLWEEKAAREHLFSISEIDHLTKKTGLILKSRTQVFLPPHFWNLFSSQKTEIMLNFTNFVFSRIPFLRNHGGIIVIEGKKIGK